MEYMESKTLKWNTDWKTVQVFKDGDYITKAASKMGVFIWHRFQAILVSIKQVRKTEDYSFPGIKNRQFWLNRKGTNSPFYQTDLYLQQLSWSQLCQWKIKLGIWYQNLAPKPYN